MAVGGIFSYVACAESREIRVLRLDAATGKLTTVQELGVSGSVSPMAISPDRRFLFAALRSQPFSVVSFAIDQHTGQLTYLNDAPLPLSALFVSVDATGRYLFATSIPESKARRHSMLSVTPIGPHGFVHAPQQVFRAEPKIHSIMPDPTNRYVYAASCIADMVLCYSFDAATGQMSQSAGSATRTIPNAGPRHMAFHPNGSFFYLLNETDASLYAFGYDRLTGLLTELQIVDTIAEHGSEDGQGADIHVTPNGRFLYASERGSSSLVGFKIDATGRLEQIGRFPTEERPRGFRIDPFGRYLLTAGQYSHHLSVDSIDRETGHLERVASYPMGRGPNWVEIVRLW